MGVSKGWLFMMVAVILVASSSSRNAFRAMFPESYPPMLDNGVDPGQPLFLTPYLESGHPELGKVFKFAFFLKTKPALV